MVVKFLRVFCVGASFPDNSLDIDFRMALS